MADFVIKENDLLPFITARFVDPGGNPVDLTTAVAVFFEMRRDHVAPNKVLDAAVVDVAANGEVHYAWQTGDTDTVGSYLAHWTTVFPGGRQSFPLGDSDDTGYLHITILPELA